MNALKGEVSFASGSDRYTLVFTIDALIQLEETFDGSVQKIASLLGADVRMSDLRTIFAAGLMEHHGDMDARAVGRLMSEIGLGPATALVAKAFKATFEIDKGAGPGGGKGPRKPAGTGAAISTSG